MLLESKWKQMKIYIYVVAVADVYLSWNLWQQSLIKVKNKTMRENKLSKILKPNETKRNKLLRKNTKIVFLFIQTAAHYKAKMEIKLREYSSAERISKWSKCNTHKSRRLAFEQSIKYIWFWISVNWTTSLSRKGWETIQINQICIRRKGNAH